MIKPYLLIIFIGIVFLLFLAFVLYPFMIEEPNNRNAVIKNNMGQIVELADSIYKESGSYNELRCQISTEEVAPSFFGGEMNNICDNIERQGAGKLIINSSKDEYCAYSKLDGGGYFCIDSKAVAEIKERRQSEYITRICEVDSSCVESKPSYGIITYIHPGQDNYRNGLELTCPKEKGGSLVDAINKEAIFYIILFTGIAYLVLTWVGFKQATLKDLLIQISVGILAFWFAYWNILTWGVVSSTMLSVNPIYAIRGLLGSIVVFVLLGYYAFYIASLQRNDERVQATKRLFYKIIIVASIILIVLDLFCWLYF